tara:strand:- start:707 stop:934 length:228 start_codon:yes stop_codon:yes gene_type:complete
MKYALHEMLAALEYYHPKPFYSVKMHLKPPLELRKQLVELRLIKPDNSPFGEDFELTEFGEQLSELNHAYMTETC